jgi:hypothetical protein
MTGEFLSRWSRLKKEARQAERHPPADDAAQSRADPLLEAPPPDEAVEAALTSEEIAELPKIEEITAASDISAFLRRGVPDALRNAALRKAWTLDPAIRDFVGEARDYDYDWNTPGGVPGAGALAPEDDVAAMVRQVFGDSVPEDAAGDPSEVESSQDREAVSDAETAGNDATQRELTSHRHDAGDPKADLPGQAARIDDEPLKAAAAPQPERAQKLPAVAASPRHGGAKPV